MNRPESIVFHTAGTEGEYDIAAIRRYHVETKGWSDVGYHWFIRRDGTRQKGREEYVEGAHCKHGGMNRKSIGVCFEGHHDLEQLTYEQVLSFLQLVKELFSRYPSMTIANVIGHREAGSPKTCPGTLVDCDRIRGLIRIYI